MVIIRSKLKKQRGTFFLPHWDLNHCPLEPKPCVLPMSCACLKFFLQQCRCNSLFLSKAFTMNLNLETVLFKHSISFPEKYEKIVINFAVKKSLTLIPTLFSQTKMPLGQFLELKLFHLHPFSQLFGAKKKGKSVRQNLKTSNLGESGLGFIVINTEQIQTQ